jgi:hypothetical protein
MWERQHNVTPAEQLRTAHHISKSSSDDLAIIPSIGHLFRLILGCVLLVTGIVIFSFAIPRRAVLGLGTLVAGSYLIATAFHRKTKMG